MSEEFVTVPAEEETHRTIAEVMFDIWAEIFGFFKYIFYDIFLGK